ncbi:MAG TPA: c-type cytochrome domain-containing protein [Verrucomicrobiae bacterium]|nr:c-type cytochrome domain-containing protein [Verrucomicrobiae bacterium]
MKTPVDRHVPRITHRASHFAFCLSRVAFLGLPIVAGVAALRLVAAGIDLSKLPASATEPVDYERDILPIFETACFRCHGREKPKSNFRLDNQQSALKGGEHGAAIKPGDSANSLLIHYVAGLVEDMEMPPPGKGERLTPEQIALLRAWIDQGPRWPTNLLTLARETSLTITPTIHYVRVKGDTQKFREHYWQQEGFTAGYEQFELRHPVGEQSELVLDGRALIDQNDYRVGLSLSHPTLGFVRAGYDICQKYFDDTGGYYRPFNLPPPGLDRDLHVDIGKAWFDAGLTLPDLPRVALGYEYQFRKGNQSTLQWGQVSDDPAAFFGKAIYPGFKQIDEETHIIKLDADYEVGGFRLEDNLRAEFYDLRNTRVNQGDFNPDVIARHDETYRHFQAANTLRTEKQLREWLFLSGGYLYTHLDGDGAFGQAFGSVSAAFPTFTGDTSDRIALKQDSHTVNLNTMLGPWRGLTLSAGVQSEWMRREGLSDLLVSAFPAALPAAASSNMDKWVLEEDVALRYNTVPYTVFYAEGRFQQEQIDHFESAFLGLQNQFDDSRDFVRDTDAIGDLRQYKAGFTFSPAPRVSWEASYKFREKKNEYDHSLDSDGSPVNGYPAFIRSRDIIGDEIETRLVLRLASWAKTTLKYQRSATDYHTSVADLTSGITNVIYPGGEILAGNEDAHVYSVNATITPWRRLYGSATFSYRDSRLVSFVNGAGMIAAYEGDIYSVLSSGTFALNDRTDFRATYSFSRADYRQDNEAAGLPLGIRYDRHGLLAGLTRKFTQNLTGSVQYGFFRYREPTAAGANDYKAHAIMASLALKLP